MNENNRSLAQFRAADIARELKRIGTEKVEAFITENVQQLPFTPRPAPSLLDKVSLITDDMVMDARRAFAAGFPYRADKYAGVPVSPPQGSSIAGPSTLIGRVIDRSS